MNIIEQARQTLIDAPHADALVKCFQFVATRPTTGLAKMRSTIFLASDDKAEIDTFTALYADMMKTSNVLTSDHVHEVSWKDLTADKPYQRVKDAFNKAGGGILLIRDAYAQDADLLGRMKNYSVFASICEQLDKAEINNGDFVENANKPVVVMTGDEKSFPAAFAAEKQAYYMRSLLVVGM